MRSEVQAVSQNDNKKSYNKVRDESGKSIP